ncbi:MAG: IS110 family transposase [Gemmatimonadota bacterium]|nr:IS110 family transposase [Gemmatimonadota bacterium]
MSSIDGTIYLGLDVHKDSVTIAVLPAGAVAPTRVERLPNDLAKLRRFCERLGAPGEGTEVRACYEASGAGYVLHRAFTSWGIHCDVIAPSLIPTKPGHQRKHDAYDAAQLARLYRAGELTIIRIPSEAEERVRDVVRCRETFQREILKSRHYILKFLARRGFVYREGTNWRQPHYAWLRRLSHATSPLAPEDRQVFSEYLGLLEYKLSRRDELDRQIAALALTPALAAVVHRLQCFRGLQLHGAMVLATELVDWRRFESPRQLMAYLGLVPRERSSGDRERRGSLTKAGNSHCRHVLVQAAWAYRFQPKIGVALKARQQGQSPVVIAHAWKAQHRLHTFYRRLAMRTRPQIAVVAVARELVGFLWAVMQEAPAPVAVA